MNHRVPVLGLLVGVVFVSVGCASTQGWSPTTGPSKSKPIPTDNEATAIPRAVSDTPTGGRAPSVHQAVWTHYANVPPEMEIEGGGTQPPTVPMPTAPTTPQPRELPSGVTPAPPMPSATAGPHVRTTPTATGGLLNLAPGELPIDRVVELARQLATAEDENRVLRARIRELEANGSSREHSVAEMVREVETAASEINATQAVLRAQKTEIAALKARLQQLEEEDLQTLTILVDLLERLLKQPASRAPSGKERP